MGRYIMIAQSKAKEGRNDEYNHWYDNIHLAEVCEIPGVISGRRFEAVPTSVGAPGLRHLAIYDIEADDPNTVIAELQRRSADGKLSICDALDTDSAVLWLYKAR